MATVYLGHDIRHEREVAIKVLHKRYLDNAEALYRLGTVFVLKGLDAKALVDAWRAATGVPTITRIALINPVAIDSAITSDVAPIAAPVTGPTM